ncbi:hypothetical protein [Bradyrhizobium manausense]|uniref:Chemotaxis protein n=1 Tax=Bradyrhizobium manausense TaxID=989370 RepID=A0A0R3DZG1_9BRAD|nr:hypothetical protein [Bradyrhizobium manausense]KRQ15345.1 hypothetical protein AOQ71_10115 [Bradyrhizobium manausense]
MHNMLRLHWNLLGLRKSVLSLALVAGSGFSLMATPTACFSQPLDAAAAGSRSVGQTTPIEAPNLSQAKIEEIILQFILVGLFGGLFTFVLSTLRDSKVRNESNLASLRDLIMQVDDLYRATKQTKRMIRARLEQRDDGYQIVAKFFAARMEELSNTQLKLEQIRNAIRTRRDLFDETRRKRILDEIEYSDDYLHQVVHEFETRKVTWCDAYCRISSSCKTLMDFFGESQQCEEIEADIKIMRDANATLDRFGAFKRIIGKTGNQRHKRVSDACMLLVIREMRDIVLERQRRLIDRLMRGSIKSPTAASSPNDEMSNRIQEDRGVLERVG